MTRLLSILLLLLILPACRPPDPIAGAAAVAVSPAGGRMAAAGQLAGDWKAGAVQFDAAINHAIDMLDSARNGTVMLQTGQVAKSTDATLFAGAVLDAMQMCDAKLPKDDNSVLMWYRVGNLAFRAAEEAHTANRLPEAMSLVLAGPTHWQNEGYWSEHPNHDGLASIILAKSGRRAEAIARLQNHAILHGLAEEVYEMLQRGQ
ncbi:hypothetical protein PHYC_00138 [Phycisphaerales bacterium]|nr:hypothetical protein PHYC_00138 [Phycisphaerales bacterium]